MAASASISISIIAAGRASLLITRRGPFDAELLAPEIGARGPDWRDRFLAAAGAGLEAEMVWFELVNAPSRRRARRSGDRSDGSCTDG